MWINKSRLTLYQTMFQHENQKISTYRILYKNNFKYYNMYLHIPIIIILIDNYNKNNFRF